MDQLFLCAAYKSILILQNHLLFFILTVPFVTLQKPNQNRTKVQIQSEFIGFCMPDVVIHQFLVSKGLHCHSNNYVKKTLALCTGIIIHTMLKFSTMINVSCDKSVIQITFF